MQPLEPRRGLPARSRTSLFKKSRSGTSRSRTSISGSSPLNSSLHAGISPASNPQANPSHPDTSSDNPSKLIFRADNLPPQHNSLLRDGLITLLLFLLLSEWLRPLAWMGDELIQIGPILVVFALCLALDCFRVPYGWGWLAKCSIIVVFIGYMFNRQTLLAGGWVLSLVRTLAQDFVYIVQAHFDLISGEMRTLLFLMGWALLLSVVQALMLQRQHSLWFVMATLIYLVGIQLVLGADTVQGIIRTLGYGLILMALLNLSRIEQTYRVTTVRSRHYLQWLIVSVVVVGMLSGLGWLSAKQTESEPLMKPVSWAHWYDRLFEYYEDETGVSPAVATSGYGQNDTSLGGPLQVDTSPVFTAKTSELTYWRGESKSFYDGKGWTQPTQKLEPFVASSSSVTAPVIVQEILMNEKAANKQLFVGGGLRSVDMLLSEKGKLISPGSLLSSETSGLTTLPEIADPLSYYKITVQPIKENPDLLNTDIAPYPEEITREYLQLPESLPRTVRSTAEQVTINRLTPYAKAVAIEQYLSQTFPYSLEKPTNPSRSEDFVSHFLFVDRTGYCDHFSTAMVVMLRSVGVPARWVKGFAQGTVDATDDNGLHEVVVRNQDAHSWVEVYFPSMGWVPFEPTPGFSGISVDQPRDMLTTATMEQLGMTASLTNTPVTKSVISKSSEWLHTMKNNLIQLVKAYKSAVFVLICSICLLVGLYVVLRRQGYLLRRTVEFSSYNNGSLNQQHPLTPYMDRLWRQLFRKYGVKPANQTVREYVMNLQVTHQGQQQALMAFAHIYESVRYDPARAVAYSKREIAAIWKAIQKTH
ncbi:transglutaminase TgpA family protein [Paenibacillus sp. LjRoot56]|uniref:transglutaminase TgpA family protein n=1 Tax=Paenibacillus sp. LjRoot56 TaxID=3342333 RepID=UPI003ECC9E3F